MGQSIATAADMVTALDTHVVMVPTPGGPVPTPMPNPFTGRFTGGLIASVLIAGQPVVAVGSVATNQPAHTPVGGPFQVPPTNTGTVHMGSAGTMIGGRAVARHGDPVRTCNDPVEAPVGQIIATNPSVKFG